MGKIISGYWHSGDKVCGDGVRLEVIAKRMAAEMGVPQWHQGSTLSFGDAKKLAIAMLYDSDYRKWRTAQIAAPQTATGEQSHAL